ncbi:MAG: hypothetical protein SAK29_40190 [Scytonema sp. PMC 1069.18]|nr:hypothetical protein [Scytonema sp. PMC 1069.18]MEC4888313.1 hypothetical protein [Scytonema sp. PMC 1070.18]
MERYREIFRLAAQQMIQDSNDKLSGVTAESVAAFASSLVVGHALQVMFDPEQFNAEDILFITKVLFIG